MSEMQPIHVAVGLLLDQQQLGQVWVFQRRLRKNMWLEEWQLPGKKFEEGEVAADALRASLEEKLAISPKRIEYLKTLPPVPHGEALYVAHCHEVSGFKFETHLIEHNLYGAARSVNPMRRHLGSAVVSPITRDVFDALIRGTRGEPDGMLLQSNPIQ